jgi:hypothetical protein
MAKNSWVHWTLVIATGLQRGPVYRLWQTYREWGQPGLPYSMPPQLNAMMKRNIQGFFTPYVLKDLPVNLWGRDVL